MADYPFHYDMPAVRISDSEIAVQKQCLDMIAKLFPNTRVAAVPNGQKRTRWQQMQAKREGMSKGFLDLVVIGEKWVRIGSGEQSFLVVRPAVAFVEIKAAGTLTAEQRDWLDFLVVAGHHCGVFRSDRTLEVKLREWGFR